MRKQWLHDSDSGDDTSPQGAASEAPSSFMLQLDATRQRSKRLHTDPEDLEGPGKFHEMRKLRAYTRELCCLEDFTHDFKRGDICSVQPGGDPEEHGDRALGDDFCTVVGKAWARGHLEVQFRSDRQVVAVEAARLVRLTRAEIMAREFRLRRGGEY